MNTLRSALLSLLALGMLLWGSILFGPVELGLAAGVAVIAGLACAVAAIGPSAPVLAVRGAAAGDPSRVAPRALLALQQWAHGTLIAGVVIGLLAALLLFAEFRLPEAERAPARFATLAKWSMIGPLAGVSLGRLWLGGLADASGGTQPDRDRALLLGALVIPVITIIALAVPA